MATDSERGSRYRAGAWQLWFGLLGAAGAWIVHLIVNYFLVPFACDAGLEVILYVTALATAVVAAAAVFVAWRSWQRTREQGQDTGLVVQRSSFMALSGILLSGLFLFIIVVQSLPIFLQSPCVAAGSLRI